MLGIVRLKDVNEVFEGMSRNAGGEPRGWSDSEVIGLCVFFLLGE